MNSESTEAVRILLVEDAAADVALARREIARELPGCEFRCVETQEAFVAELSAFQPHLVVSDYQLPQFDGLTALRLVQELSPLTPLIIMTGSRNENTAVNCMKAGAANYVIKEHSKRLGQSVVRALAEARLRQERLAVERALQKSETYFRSLIENAQDLITVIDADTRVRFQSPSVEKILGYPPARFLHEKILDFIHPDDQAGVTASLQRTLADGQIADAIEFRIRHADGSWRVFECTGKRLQGEVPPALVVNARDVTGRHRLEEQLRQAQKMEAIGQLAGGVAHDFNNLLTSIMGNATLLCHEQSLPPEQAATVREIILAAERASDLTRQLLLFSRKQALQPASLDLNEVVSQTVKMLQRLLGEQITVRLDCAASLPLIRGDLGMIDQVLLNLAVNARDAMPEGGRLLIRTSVRAPTTGTAAAAVCLTVTDTGCGIHPDHLNHIFEPFFTTKEAGKGTGLGLATVYGIVKQHGGAIDVVSRLHHGTTFEIIFPAYEGPGETAPPAAAAPAIPSRGELILVVEDELAVRLVVNRMLQRSGYEVLSAASGPEALEVWAQNKNRIQLLLTDIVLPDGMTGSELVARLRDEAPDLRVIYSSGYNPEMAGKNLAPNVDVRFLQKPYSFAELTKTVRECLDAPTGMADCC